MFRMKACARLAPLICRSPSSQSTGSRWTCPRLPNRPGFDDGWVSFDRTSAVHFRSPSWPAPDESSSPFPGPFTTWELIPTQRRVVWGLILQPAPEGPASIFHAARLLHSVYIPTSCFCRHGTLWRGTGHPLGCCGLLSPPSCHERPNLLTGLLI